jgi:hypothetical protein
MTIASVTSLFPEPDPADVAAADEAVREVIRTQFGTNVPSLVIVRSVAGGGKTTLLVILVGRVVRDRGECVAVAANTDHQSFLLTRRLVASGVDVVLFVTETKAVPADLDASGGATLHVCRSEAELRQLLDDQLARQAVGLPDTFAIVANTAKWRSVPGLSTAHRQAMRPVAPLLVIDEAFQMNDDTADDMLSVGERWVAVGDPGQIDPPATVDTSEWEHRLDGPHRPFPEAQVARSDPASPGLVELELPYTRRNPEDGLPFVEPFYDQPVRSLVPTGSRRLAVDPASRSHPLDEAIDAAAAGDSVSAVVLPAEATGGQTDAGIARAIAETVDRLLARSARVLVHTDEGFRDLSARDVMVIATHHDQLAQLAPLLDPEVQLGTADSLQGEDAPIVLAWHPLSGAPEPDTFHCDAGRTCVMLTRHTVAVILFTRDGVGEMLDDQQPTDLLVPGNARDSVRRAWRAQRTLFSRLTDDGRVHRT